ncbi:MAG: hypothetical protein WAW36_13240 [Methylovulum miyakonense]|uniref:hypothetical protein n=1 Tax=Methylovulum miyakonense TaxID=645578 RepID=UPI003BB70F29
MTKFKPGDYYEDCSYHPCICVSVEDDGDSVSGISLVDGSYPRSCSVKHCGLRKLTLDEAILWKQKGPQNLLEPWIPLPDRQWWWPMAIEGISPGECLEHLFSFSLLFLRNYAEHLLGYPIVGWFAANGGFSSVAAEPYATVEYQAKGSLQLATVKVEAVKEGRLWPIIRISILTEKSSEPVIFEGEQVRGCGHAG